MVKCGPLGDWPSLDFLPLLGERITLGFDVHLVQFKVVCADKYSNIDVL